MNKSLKQIGEVTSDLEIRALVPTLLKTSFMHYINHSSLAFVCIVICISR